jgi:site-specific DNA-methyltransferase (adenine-specific)
MTIHEVYQGDAWGMLEVGGRPVHRVVTSPPYWTLKRYDGGAGADQLGHFEDYEDYHRLRSKFRQR